MIVTGEIAGLVVVRAMNEMIGVVMIRDVATARMIATRIRAAVDSVQTGGHPRGIKRIARTVRGASETVQTANAFRRISRVGKRRCVMSWIKT